jgi:hypothetical protein
MSVRLTSRERSMMQFVDSTVALKMAFSSGRELKRDFQPCKKPPKWTTYRPFKQDRDQVIYRDRPPSKVPAH